MLPTQETIDQLACRIERAFCRRNDRWHRGCSTPRVWSAAAINLLRAHQEDPGLPIDPELFVASQPAAKGYTDPWGDLAQVESIDRYLRRVSKIVKLLRAELGLEVARGERFARRGIDLSRIVTSPKARLSPLGGYIVARRAGRDDLAGELFGRALAQHQSCPLYREACSVFLPDDFYVEPEPYTQRDISIYSTGMGVCNSLLN